MPVPPWWSAPSIWPRRCAFHDTGLEEALRSRGIDTLIITGIATNFGVEQTARFADEFGFQVIVPEDAVTALDAWTHEFAFDYIFPRIATVSTTAEVVAAASPAAPRFALRYSPLRCAAKYPKNPPKAKVANMPTRPSHGSGSSA